MTGERNGRGRGRGAWGVVGVGMGDVGWWFWEILNVGNNGESGAVIVCEMWVCVVCREKVCKIKIKIIEYTVHELKSFYSTKKHILNINEFLKIQNFFLSMQVTVWTGIWGFQDLDNFQVFCRGQFLEFGFL